MMITARDLGRTFGAFTAVDGVNLSIAEGEVFGILGPNGAGKTTMVRMLTSIIAPTRGTATVAGYDVVTEAREVRARVGILTETPGIYVRLDAVENLRFFGELQGVRNLEARIREVLQRLDLWNRRNEPVGGWSKGMRQRLAIARAVLHEPQVVFLDEPTSALDPVAARAVRDLMDDLRRERRTVVLCTHNLDEAERMCDRIGLLQTTLLRVDTPAALMREARRGQVRIQLIDPSERYLDLLRELPFVRSVGCVRADIAVELEEPERNVPELIRLLVQSGAQIRGVQDSHRSLEQVYFEVLGQPAPGANS